MSQCRTTHLLRTALDENLPTLHAFSGTDILLAVQKSSIENRSTQGTVVFSVQQYSIHNCMPVHKLHLYYLSYGVKKCTCATVPALPSALASLLPWRCRGWKNRSRKGVLSSIHFVTGVPLQRKTPFAFMQQPSLVVQI